MYGNAAATAGLRRGGGEGAGGKGAARVAAAPRGRLRRAQTLRTPTSPARGGDARSPQRQVAGFCGASLRGYTVLLVAWASVGWRADLEIANRDDCMVRALSKSDEAKVYDAGQCVVEVHRRLSAWLRVGVTLDQIDTYVAKTLAALNCKSCFLRYRIPRMPPFPSHSCLSVNECVVHGHVGYFNDPMMVGDVLKIDIGVVHKGWIGDAARTYVFGEMTPLIRRLTDAGKESILRGIEQLQPGRKLIEWARAVQEYVEGACGFHLVEGLGGHGFGKRLHAPPLVSNTLPKSKHDWPDAQLELRPGMLLAVEPMIAVGTSRLAQNPNQWPVFISDGSQSVHYEHDVLITERGPRVLTEGLDEVPDVVLR